LIPKHQRVRFVVTAVTTMQASASTLVSEQREDASTSSSPDNASIDTLLWDLDGTLYPIENGYEDHVRQAAYLCCIAMQSVSAVQFSCIMYAEKTYSNSCIKSWVYRKINARQHGDLYLPRQTRA